MEPQPGHLIGGKYRLLRKLGEGAMGTVWAVRNEMTEREFALKLVSAASADDPDLRDRLLREARAGGRITHRNVMELYDVGQTDDGHPFLVMQLLTGGSLEDRLAAGPLDQATAVLIAAQIARGLEAAHAAGVIHRDLKPGNIFLHTSPEGEHVVKLVDFGVSKVLTGDGPTSTVTGLAIGSPAYMSPEQARGEKQVDPRTDLWALGVVLFEMLSGTRPFEGDTAFDTVAEILRGEIPRLVDRVPSADPRIVALVDWCMQREKEQRPESASRVLEALSPLLVATEGGREALPSYPGLGSPPSVAPAIAVTDASVSTVSPATHTARGMPTRPQRVPWLPIGLAGGGLVLVLGVAAIVVVRAAGSGSGTGEVPSAAAAGSGVDEVPASSAAVASAEAAPKEPAARAEEDAGAAVDATQADAGDAAEKEPKKKKPVRVWLPKPKKKGKGIDMGGSPD